jgi:hypothetical protein
MAIPPQTHLNFLNSVVNALIDKQEYVSKEENDRIIALKSHRLAYRFDQQQLDDLAEIYANATTRDQWNNIISGLMKQVPAPGNSS